MLDFGILPGVPRLIPGLPHFSLIVAASRADEQSAENSDEACNVLVRACVCTRFCESCVGRRARGRSVPRVLRPIQREREPIPSCGLNHPLQSGACARLKRARESDEPALAYASRADDQRDGPARPRGGVCPGFHFPGPVMVLARSRCAMKSMPERIAGGSSEGGAYGNSDCRTARNELCAPRLQWGSLNPAPGASKQLLIPSSSPKTRFPTKVYTHRANAVFS
jgi:hypothetical protein